MDNRPIGIFDSGVGGLAVVKYLRKLLPNEDIIYLGDTARVPYGTRSRNIIEKYSIQDVKFLLSKSVKFVIAACGTASSVLYGRSEKNFSFHYSGIIEPTCDTAIKLSIKKKIGIIGTSATIKLNRYQEYIKKYDKNINIYSKDCPLFVPLIENGFIESTNKITSLMVERYLEDMRGKIDTLILGCTHYPIIKNHIQDYFGKEINIVDAGFETAKFAKNYLEKNNMYNYTKKNGEVFYYITDDKDSFGKTGSIFLDEDIFENISVIDLDIF